MRVLQVTNNEYYDPWCWTIREQATGLEIGIVLPDGKQFEAIDHITKRRAKGAKLKSAVQSLYTSMDESVEVRIAPDISRTGLPGYEPMDPALIQD